MHHTVVISIPSLHKKYGLVANGYNGRFNLQLPAGITYKDYSL